jgi:ubiquinone/menaquinone biosynthesis C-methylase UbiE
LYGARVVGIDPSDGAIADGRARFPHIAFARGTADALPFPACSFDFVCFGFCLYLCDRSDLFRIVAEADRVLTDGGHLVIYDFYVRSPYRRVYHHDRRMFSYKMDYTRLFLANPAYRLLTLYAFGTDGGCARDEDDTVAVGVLRKHLESAFPLR